MRVSQWVPAAHAGDAIGDEALRIREVLLSEGFDSDVYALTIDDEVRSVVKPFPDPAQLEPADVTILHFALPSPLTAAFRDARGKKILVYHNITPATYFVGFDDELVRIASLGREHLRELAPTTDLALGDSEFNRRELEAEGFRKTGVFPILVDFSRYDRSASPVLSAMFDDDRSNFLFVGRVFPNKRFEDLARLAFFYKKYVSENFRFTLVGKAGRMERYQQSVEALAERWGLRTAEFAFLGHVSWEELVACYETADVFVSMSEHEGFSVPLVESMLFDVPILAYRAGAVPDTLGAAGVLFDEKKYDELAEMAYLLATDDRARDAVVRGQQRRLDAFRPDRLEPRLLHYVQEVLA